MKVKKWNPGTSEGLAFHKRQEGREEGEFGSLLRGFAGEALEMVEKLTPEGFRGC